MLMVVFGAGASYDSSPDHLAPANEDIRPPLAQELFTLRRINAQAASGIPKSLLLIDQLRHLQPETSVEQELEKLRDRAKDYPEGKRQLVAIQFYLQWVISQTQYEWNQYIHHLTNYRTLLGQIDRHRNGESVCFVTFNYDTLLEEAFTSLASPAMSFSSLNDYVSGGYKVIKLHGSVNWVREIAEPTPTTMVDHVAVANFAIMDADKVELGRYHIADLHPQTQPRYVCSFMEVPRRTGREIVFPAIAIPFQTKTDFECPHEHQEVLDECIPSTDRLLIIGWKGAEEKFTSLLAAGLKKDIPKMIVSRNRESASKISDRLEAFTSVGPNFVGEAGFTGELRSGRIENFLARRLPIQ
jgi:hypothetical protein